jgi:hypothetical protein
MKRIRNPRYAPEFLERKLSPSAFLVNNVAPAVVADNPPPTDPTDPPMPEDGNGFPPTDPYPFPPIGPVVPA